MAMDELVAYVVLLSLPLWLLIEQLLFIRGSRPSEPPPAERRVGASALPEALRSGQR
jgi:hypothetical protein